MKVIVTGSRDWDDKQTVYRELDALAPSVIIHGGARGADALAHRYALAHHIDTLVYEADWKKYGRGAGARRNQLMVDEGADFVLAFPLPNSVGTWDCWRRATTAGIPGKIVYGAGEFYHLMEVDA